MNFSLVLAILLGVSHPCLSNSVEGWTEYVRVNMLQEVLENQYLRTPIALVLDISSKTVRNFKTLWWETAEQGLPDREIMFFPVSEKDIGSAKIYNSERLSGLLGELHPAADASVEEDSVAGALITAALAATAKLPYDSAVLIATGGAPKDIRIAPIMAEMLIRKRARLYVIWTGEQNGEEDVLREIALLTGGALYYMETNAVIRTRMLRIENSDLDQTIISRHDIVDRLESSFIIPEGDPGFRIRLIGNLSLASLIDPQGHSKNLIEALREGETDIIVTTQEQPSGAWLLITEGVDNSKYDVFVLKDIEESTEENSTDGSVEELEEENSTLRHRRAAQDGINESKINKFEYPEETRSKNGSAKIVTQVLGEQKSVSLVSVPIIVELASGSNLEVRPGATTTLVFEVTNNLNIDTGVTFSATGRGVNVRGVQPVQAVLMASATTKVEVIVGSQTAGGTATLTFSVYGGGRLTSRSANIYITTTPISDSWNPKIDYKFNGDCKQFETPANCNNGQWSLDVTIKDEDSGLLRIMSEPFGLVFSTEFIAGTKSPMSAIYTATCCKPRVDIWAEDLRGNYKKKSFDVFHPVLYDGEIAAIVLAILLLIILVLLIVMIVLFCRKRKTDTIILPRHRAGSR